MLKVTRWGITKKEIMDRPEFMGKKQIKACLRDKGIMIQLSPSKLTELIQKWKTEANERNTKGNLIRQVMKMFMGNTENALELRAECFFHQENSLRRCALELDDLIKGIPPEKHE